MGSAEGKANLHTSAADNQHGRLNDSLSLTEMLTVTLPGQSFICTAVPATNMQVHTSAEESQEDPINCNTMYSCNSPVSRSGIYVTFKVNDTLITANISVMDESLIGMNLTCLATYRGDTSINVSLAGQTLTQGERVWGHSHSKVVQSCRKKIRQLKWLKWLLQ